MGAQDNPRHPAQREELNDLVIPPGHELHEMILPRHYHRENGRKTPERVEHHRRAEAFEVRRQVDQHPNHDTPDQPDTRLWGHDHAVARHHEHSCRDSTRHREQHDEAESHESSLRTLRDNRRQQPELQRVADVSHPRR